MGRKILGGIVGIIVAVAFVAAVEALAHALYAPPGVQAPEGKEAMKAFVDALPIGAFLMVLLAHLLGSLAGSLAATLTSGRSSILPGMVVGGLLLVSGIVNLTMVPHPVWFMVVDVLLFLPAAYLGARLVLRGPPPPSAALPATP